MKSDQRIAAFVQDQQSLQRFWSRTTEEPSGCIVWRGASTFSGYGLVSTGTRNSNVYAHRISWWATNGPIPSGMLVCHTCDNPPCVNPEHLWLGTDFDNAMDKVRKGRSNTPVGEQSGKARLTRATVIAVRENIDAMSTAELARAIGVAASTVSMAQRGLSWRHA